MTVNKNPAPEKAEYDAIQAKIEALLEPLEGWCWAYKTIDNSFVTHEQLHEALRAMHNKMGGLAFLLNQIGENCDLDVEKSTALLFAAEALKEEADRISSIWPDSTARDNNWISFAHPANLKSSALQAGTCKAV